MTTRLWMELYLVRHAIAEERDAERWPDDALRPLTDDGRRRFKRAAAGLRRLVPVVDALLSSPYLRARETAEILAKEAGWGGVTLLDGLAPGHDPGDLLKLLRPYWPSNALALVGHAPDLELFASFLLTGSPSTLSMEWRKGGVVAMATTGQPAAGGLTLRWALPPRVLRAIG
jgi:phosphohistidine phosphatase